MDQKVRDYLREYARQKLGQGLCPICRENTIDASDSECPSCNIDKFLEQMEAERYGDQIQLADSGFYDLMDSITDGEDRHQKG